MKNFVFLSPNFPTNYWKFCKELKDNGMRVLGNPLPGDARVISGESGGVTMGLLDLLMTAPDLAPLRRDMGLNRQSVVLLISTEGDTDPVHYQKVMTHD